MPIVLQYQIEVPKGYGKENNEKENTTKGYGKEYEQEEKTTSLHWELIEKDVNIYLNTLLFSLKTTF